jgi:hypothetical protein
MLHPHADWQRPRPPHSAPSTPRTRHTRRTRPVAHCRAESGSVGCMADILCCDLDCRTILGHWYWYWYWYWYVYWIVQSQSESRGQTYYGTYYRSQPAQSTASYSSAQQWLAGRPAPAGWLLARCSLQPATLPLSRSRQGPRLGRGANSQPQGPAAPRRSFAGPARAGVRYSLVPLPHAAATVAAQQQQHQQEPRYSGGHDHALASVVGAAPLSGDAAVARGVLRGQPPSRPSPPHYCRWRQFLRRHLCAFNKAAAAVVLPWALGSARTS